MGKTFEAVRQDEPVEELMGDLSDALEILYSCRRMNVPVTSLFLDYIDNLIDRLEVNRPYSLVEDQSSNPRNTGSGVSSIAN